MPLLFASTLFVSAILLFWVQPMIAKMMLPLLGGTPAVWNTCMVFFQAMLLAGYAYAHFLTSWFGLRKQVLIHMALLLLAALILPIGIPEHAVQSLPSASNPTAWLLGCLLSAVGLPFFIVSTSAPLLQKWFSNTGHPSAKDPYFLYAASNFGSLIALLGYPVFMEPSLRLREQSWLWSAGYAGFATLSFLCVFIVSRTRLASARRVSELEVYESSLPTSNDPVTLPQRLRWIILAFIPSSLMLGVTTYLTTDIASIPLLWVLPLSIYLVTFVLAFARRQVLPAKLMIRALPIGAIGLTYLILSEATEPPWLLIVLHLLFFFIAAMVCHGQLAQARPPISYLTEFYLWISVGGVLGGVFNALLAPNLFSRVIEYQLVMILLCFLFQPVKQSNTRQRRVLDLALPLGVGLLTVMLAIVSPRLNGWPLQLRLAIIFGLPLLICYTMVDRRVRFGLALGLVMLGSFFYTGTHGRTFYAKRNFFGVLRVTLDPTGTFHRLIHGNTIHGRQFIDPSRRCEPLSYYHRTGPLGQIFNVFNQKPASSTIAVVGLGAGSMACYAMPHQSWTFYEINPVVIQIANDTNYFSFLKQCTVAETEVIVGDARLQLRNAPKSFYDMILLDAFSSDAIPIHLITREAIDLYLSKLADGGILALHISNRCLDLEPVVGALAKNAHLIAHANDENEPSADERADGKDQSHWVVMARRREDLGKLAKDSRWLPLSATKNAEIWTDDFSNILSVFRWQ
ncbi:MAG: hypothetical protein EXS30_08460 [Pedosphaera sp.]|nr:hypothetical protein [Pedosphaera sp.]